MISNNLLDAEKVPHQRNRSVVAARFVEANEIVAEAKNGKKFQQERSQHPTADVELVYDD